LVVEALLNAWMPMPVEPGPRTVDWLTVAVVSVEPPTETRIAVVEPALRRMSELSNTACTPAPTLMP